MQALKSQLTQRAGCILLSALLAFPTFALAQDPQAPPPPPTPNDVQAAPAPAPSTGGWKRVGDQTAQNQVPQPAPDAAGQQAPPPPPPPEAQQQQQAPPPPQPPQANGNPQPYGQPQGGYPAYGQQQPNYGPPPQGYPQQQQPVYQNQQPVPASLTIPAGTYLTVRINQMLSSEKNQVGDPFAATLIKPLVVNGVVIAEPGQTIGGHVAEVQKAGHVSGLARLGVALTDLALVDGQQLPIKTSLVSRTGPGRGGEEAGTIVGTTALGAAVGAAAAWGRGAAIGAGAGLVVGLAGVLVTHGHPSILYPEQMLTFRIEAPVTIDTTHAPQAFRYVEPGEYSQAPGYGQQPGYGPYTSAPYPPAAAPAPYYAGGYPYPYPYYGYGYGYPYYYGPGFSLFLGGGYWYGGRYFYGPGRGYYGGVGVRGYGGVAGGRVGGGVVGGRSVGGGVAGHSSGGGGGHR